MINLGDKFISKTAATNVYNSVTQTVRNSRALKRVAEDMISFDGADVPPIMRKDVHERTYAQVLIS